MYSAVNLERKHKYLTKRLAYISSLICFVLAICLPFLIPFNAVKNIDLQGYVLIVIGIFAWLSITLKYRVNLNKVDKLLLVVFGLCCFISFAINPNHYYDFFGAPYIRLGFGGLLSCMGVGLLASYVPSDKLIRYLYIIFLLIAVVSLPYSLIKYHNVYRIGGIFDQADIMAATLGCGLLLGLHLFKKYPKHRLKISLAQLYMLVLLFVTETRAIILAVIVLSFIWDLTNNKVLKKRIPIYISCLVVIGLNIFLLPHSRLTSSDYAVNSLGYRYDLLKSALQVSVHKPVFGYGPGNLASALNCSGLKYHALQVTCHEGYFFNSSHNIFMDRVLALGYIGGLAFLSLVIRALYKGVRKTKELPILTYILALIAFYYLTNVTNLVLELLLWVVLFRQLATLKVKF